MPVHRDPRADQPDRRTRRGRHPGHPPRRGPRVHRRSPATCRPGHPESLVNWTARRLARRDLVLMMAVQNAPAIAAALVEGGRPARHAGRRRSATARCRGSAPCCPPSARWRTTWPRPAVRPPAIIVVGEVVAVAHPEHYALMATLHEITDPADPRLADYRDLRDVELRKHLEAEHGLFLAEGEKVVRRAVEAGFTPRSFLMAPRWLDGLDDVLSTHRRALLRRQRGTGRGGHRLPRPPRRAGLAGAAAAAGGRRRCSAGARSVLVLEDIVDHTNVGAIFRSGAALGVRRRAAGPAVRRPALPPVDQGRRWARCSRMPWTRLPGLVRRPAVPVRARDSRRSR